VSKFQVWKEFEGVVLNPEDNDHRKCYEWVQECKQLDNAPGFLMIMGKVGRGKTHMAWGTIMEGDWETIGGPYIQAWSAPSLMASLRPGGKPDDDTSVLRDCMKAGVLLLDELGTEKVSEWVYEQFEMIVTERYNYKRPTIITSNLTMSNMEERYGERIVSRMVQGATTIHVQGVDRRKKQKEVEQTPSLPVAPTEWKCTSRNPDDPEMVCRNSAPQSHHRWHGARRPLSRVKKLFPDKPMFGDDGALRESMRGISWDDPGDGWQRTPQGTAGMLGMNQRVQENLPR
jgi:hypothetical protein